ncbi:MAG: cysteine peptidase family C39 domain-containing protein [Planctomycetota bacterium]|jgi:hypothetical protein
MKALRRKTISASIFILVAVSTNLCASEIVLWKEIAANKDCGANCLVIACKLLGKETDKQEIATLTKLTVDGTNFSNMAEAARKKGLFCKGVKWDLNQLRRWKKLAIAHWENHFVLVNGFDGSNGLRIIDPPRKPFIMAKDEFVDKWDGKVLLISDNPISILVGLRYIYIVAMVIVLVLSLLLWRGFPFVMNIVRKDKLKSGRPTISAVWLLFLVGFIGFSQKNCWAKEQIKAKEEKPFKSALQLSDNMTPYHKIDFGRVQQDKKLKHVLDLVNKTDELIKIKGVTASCSCTAAVLSEKHISPNGSARIEITLDTKGTYGKLHKPALIRFDGSELRPVKLDLIAFVYVPWARFTLSSVYFDSIPCGKGAVRTFHIVNSNDPGSDWKIVEVETSSPLITARYVPNRGEMICELRKGAPEGPVNEKITVYTKDKNGMSSIEIPVLGAIEHVAKITPERVYLGTLRRRESVRKSFTLTGIGNEETVAVEGTNSNVTLDFDCQDDKGCLFRVDFSAPDEPGFFTGVITLKIGSDGKKRIIPYAGFVAG